MSAPQELGDLGRGHRAAEKVALRFVAAERLKAQGLSEAVIARIHAPIGLAIGAVSPPEIAVSIMGEITATLRQRPEAAPVAAGERRQRAEAG